MTGEEITDYAIARILKHYHKPGYREITDYDKVVELGVPLEVEEDTIMAYPCPGQTIYINPDTGYAVTYQRQKVSSEDDAYYYAWIEDYDPEDDMSYEYVTTYEWKNTSLPWLDPE